MESESRIDTFVVSGLIDMYAKCGSVEDACLVFDKSPRRNVVIWSTMMAAYTLHNDYTSALQSFITMQLEGFKPDEVTFVNALSLCSHEGLVGEGCHLFEALKVGHGTPPSLEHYTCVIDLLGRAGCLVEAGDILQSMPFLSSISGWISLLGNCKTYGNTELGRKCFRTIMSLDRDRASGHLLMSTIYSDADTCTDALSMEHLRRSACAVKAPGKAFIEIINRVHNFMVGDQIHPQQSIVCKVK